MQIGDWSAPAGAGDGEAARTTRNRSHPRRIRRWTGPRRPATRSGTSLARHGPTSTHFWRLCSLSPPGLSWMRRCARSCRPRWIWSMLAYGALGVLGDDGMLSQFVYVGIDDATRDVDRSAAHRSRRPRRRHRGRRARCGWPICPCTRLRWAFRPTIPRCAPSSASPVRARGEVFGRLYLTEKNSGRVHRRRRNGRACAGRRRPASPSTTPGSTRRSAAAALAGGHRRGHRRAPRRQRPRPRRCTSLPGTPWSCPVRTTRSSPCRGTRTTARTGGHRAEGGGVRRDGCRPITGRTIPISGSTTGAVFADQMPRNVAELAFDLADGLGVEFGPALALPLGTGSRSPGCCSPCGPRVTRLRRTRAPGGRVLRRPGSAGPAARRGPVGAAGIGGARRSGPDRPGPARSRHPTAIRGGLGDAKHPPAGENTSGRRSSRRSHRPTAGGHPGHPCRDLRSPGRPRPGIEAAGQSARNDHRAHRRRTAADHGPDVRAAGHRGRGPRPGRRDRCSGSRQQCRATRPRHRVDDHRSPSTTTSSSTSPTTASGSRTSSPAADCTTSTNARRPTAGPAPWNQPTAAAPD